MNELGWTYEFELTEAAAETAAYCEPYYQALIAGDEDEN